ncbi:serine hydrolase [Ilumatobacter sp.]|uniref:serine hydrolase n=1 Tax=Ilumatobacter sp. TaxID=1967498 RepID=UPI003B521C43
MGAGRAERRTRATSTLAAALAASVLVVSGCGSTSTGIPVPVVAPRPTPPSDADATAAATSTATPVTDGRVADDGPAPTGAARSGPDDTVPGGSTPLELDGGPPTDGSTGGRVLVPATTSPPPTTDATTVPATGPDPDDPTGDARDDDAPVADPSRRAGPPAQDPPGSATGASAPGTFATTEATFARLAAANVAASLTIVDDGAISLSTASGPTIGGAPATGDSPMIVASVSKVVVAVAIARLAAEGRLDVDAPIPWAEIGLSPDPGWADVTVREILDHRGGLKKDRDSWFDEPGTCRDHIPSLLRIPPDQHRGRWYYSNANYCLLGLVVEARAGADLGTALQRLVFDPIGRDGVHLTTDGLRPDDTPYRLAPERLSRLGGAGTVVVSTDDLAVMFATTDADDAAVLTPPSLFVDQYGTGHTGTVDGSRACLWRFAATGTVVAAAIAGDSVRSGGALCDLIVHAVAIDLGIDAGVPDRLR